MDEISIEKARPKLGDLVRDAQRYGVTTRITLHGKPAAVLVPVLTDLAARARTLAGLADEAALRQHTGETDSVLLAYVRALGEAKHLLGELADRLDPPSEP